MQRDYKLKVKNGHIWYRTVGDIYEQIPLICLHGGPGAPERFEEMYELSEKIPIIVYDRYDCGESKRDQFKNDLNLDDFVDELATLINHLKLPKVFLMGQSWGGALALGFYSLFPYKIKKFILSSPLISSQIFSSDALALRKDLPLNIDNIMTKLEDKEDYSSDLYKLSEYIFYAHFITRNIQTLDSLYNSELRMNEKIYTKLWGYSESKPTGILKDLDLSYVLNKITVPTLFTIGEFDEVREETIRKFASSVNDAKVEIIKDASHLQHKDNPEELNKVVRNFLLGV